MLHFRAALGQPWQEDGGVGAGLTCTFVYVEILVGTACLTVYKLCGFFPEIHRSTANSLFLGCLVDQSRL